jgi:HK97 family phage prohead protease
VEKKNKPDFVELPVSRRSAKFEFRMAESESGARTITGHGSVFDVLSEDLGGFREIIHRGAFDEALLTSDAFCLFNHDPNMPLGLQSAGNLDISTNDSGLFYECRMLDTTYASDLKKNIDAKVITKSSFAFTMDWSKEGRKEDGGHYEYRYNEYEDDWTLHIYKMEELFDVSPVTYPAYKAADVRSAVRGLTAAKERLTAEQKEQIDSEEAAKKDMEDEGLDFSIQEEARQRRLRIQQLTSAV